MAFDFEAEAAQPDQPPRRAEHAQSVHAEIGKDLCAEAELTPGRRGLLVGDRRGREALEQRVRRFLAGQHDDDATVFVGDTMQCGRDRESGSARPSAARRTTCCARGHASAPARRRRCDRAQARSAAPAAADREKRTGGNGRTRFRRRFRARARRSSRFRDDSGSGRRSCRSSNRARRERFELRTPRHGAVVAEDFDEHAGRPRPASRARSHAASVWPARVSTPPGCAASGKMWPGCTRSSSVAPRLRTAARIVCARSYAEMPVVTPSAASIETVKFGVVRRGVMRSTIGGKRERSAALLRQRQADQAARFADHEIDVLGPHFFGGHDQVAFVLAILVVDDHDHVAGADFGERCSGIVRRSVIATPRVRRACVRHSARSDRLRD